MPDKVFKPTVLVVDDTEANIDILLHALDEHYEVSVAMDGEMALESVAEEHPDIILLDIMMPGMDGYEVCRRLKDDPATREIPVIFITAMTQVDDETKGFDLGAVDYIAKPISIPIVQTRVNNHLALRNARLALKNQNDILEQRVRERTRELRESRLNTITCLGLAAERRDPETGSHIRRMSHYSQILAREAGLSVDEAELILHAAPMHDIGKVGVPDRILLKPARLNDDEWRIMSQHPRIGADILKNQDADLLHLAHKIALTHHEKWDGSGYPNGMKGLEIPQAGRIVAVADVFDALTSERPYKPAWSIDDSMSEMVAMRGTHFEPRLVDLFAAVLPEILAIRERFQEPG